MPDQGRVVIVDGEGKRHFFPAGFDPKRAASIVKQQAQPTSPRESGLATIGEQVQAKWSDRLGLNEPTDSPLMGFVRGAGAGAVDLTQGAVSNITGQLNAKLDAENKARQTASLPTKPTLPRVSKPDNFSGDVGAVLPMAAEVVAGGGPPVRAAINAIPRTARAAEKFKSVMAAAKNVPVDVAETGDVSLRIMQLAERGGSMPLAVRKLLNRVTDPDKAPMVYEEARDFASNISRLSADEFGRLTPAVAREVANLRVALNKANAQAAKQVGKMEEYASAMNEYARAMRLRKAVEAAVEGAKKGAPVATAAGVGYWLTQKVRDAIGQ
jgi:hypothetical protein